MVRALCFILLFSPALSDLSLSLKHFEFLHKKDVSHNVVKRGAERSENKFNHIRDVTLNALGQKFRLILSPQRGLFSGNFKVIFTQQTNSSKQLTVNIRLLNTTARGKLQSMLTKTPGMMAGCMVTPGPMSGCTWRRTGR